MDLGGLMPSDKPLSEELASYHAAISSEFRLAEVGTKEDIEKEALKRLYALVPDAINTLHQVLLNPDNDNSALKAATLVLDRTLGKPDSLRSPEDELSRIIGGLQKKDAPTPSSVIAKSD
jgi:hypothetical protein